MASDAYHCLVGEVGKSGGFQVRCVECGIKFLTKSCNRKHINLCCPFGCKKVRIARLSAKRSRIYYETPEGKKKKQELNRKRKRGKKAAELDLFLPTLSDSPDRAPVFPSKTLVEYGVFICSLMGKKSSMEEIRDVLEKSGAIWRQLSLDCFDGFCDTELRGGKGELWPP